MRRQSFKAGWCLLLTSPHLVWFYSSCVCGCSNNAICWLLWAGLVCYIFTVSVMINFLSPPCSLKQPSFTSPPLHRDRLLSQPAHALLLKAHLLNVSLSCSLFIYLNYFSSHYHLVFLFSAFLTFLTEWNVPLLQHLLGEYELFIHFNVANELIHNLLYNFII